MNKFNWSEVEILAYDQELKRIRDNISAMDYQFDNGVQQGIEQMALAMIVDGDSIEKISRIKKLSMEQILSLRNKL